MRADEDMKSSRASEIKFAERGIGVGPVFLLQSTRLLESAHMTLSIPFRHKFSGMSYRFSTDPRSEIFQLRNLKSTPHYPVNRNSPYPP